jgi:beta-glucosidase
MRKQLIAVALAWTILGMGTAQAAAPKAHKVKATAPLSEIDQKVEALLKKMTLAEKIGQMGQDSPGSTPVSTVGPRIRAGMVGSLLNQVGAKDTNEAQKVAMEESRLHIPLIMGLDVIHGFKTIFPIPLAEDCAWDPELLEKCASVAGHEASAAGIRWTFAPMVDVCREPRWGRIAEGSGEDPTLGGILAAARVRGFQGKNLSDPGSIVACAKHFVGYGAAEAGRDYNTTDMSEMTLREVHLPPFKAACDAGVRTYMSAFNDLNGIPASGNIHTLKDILKNEWGFKGFVVSDWGSIQEMTVHGFAADDKDAALKGGLAQVDMDMEGKVYEKHLAELVKEGKIGMAFIDDAVRRILKVKYEMGLFDNPYTDETKEAAAMMTPASMALALQEAEESIVLLKNEKNLLPLSKGVKTLAVIGALADSKADPLGTWHCQGDKEKVTTVLEGIKSAVSKDTRVFYDPGVGVAEDAPWSAISKAVDVAKQAQVAVVVVGETWDMSGESMSRSSLSLPGRQEEMVKAIQQAGVPVVLVLMNGRPLTIPWEAENVPAILETWFLGNQQGPAVANALFGDFNPSGKLVATFPRSVGQIPIYYAHMNTGRPGSQKEQYTSRYIDGPNSPQYPFGFGLSYTTYEYSNLQLSSDTVDANGNLTVTADVQNKGDRPGVEIVQLYIQDITASVTQPVRKLKDFQRVPLNAGEKKSVTFILPASKLGFFTNEGKYILEAGKFNLWVGKDSTDTTLKASFQLTSSLAAK